MKSNRDIAKEIEKVTTLETLLQKQVEQTSRPPRTAPATELATSSSMPSFYESQTSLGSSRKMSGRKDSDPDILKQEISSLQYALADKFNKGNQKLVSGAQFRHVGRDPGRCESCENKDALLKKSKESIRSLKFQLRQMEDRLGASTTKKFSRTTSDFDLNGSSLQSAVVDELREENESLKNKLNELEQGNSLLNSMLSNERQQASGAHNSLRQDLMSQNETILSLRDEILKSRRTEAESVDQLSMLKTQFEMKIEYASELEQELNTLRSEADELRRKCSAASDNEEEKIARKELEDQLSEAKLKNNVLQKNIDDSDMNYRVISRKLDEALASLAAFETGQKEHTDELAEARQQANVYKNLLDAANDELGNLHHAKSEDAGRYQELLDQISALQIQLAAKDVEIAAHNGRISAIQAEADTATSRMNDMVKRMTSESEKSAQAVQKAIQSSVRLCVVAPTVNVHVADKKMKFRTNVPKEKLNEFLENEILAKYTFLFEQQADNVGPDGFTDIQPWIKRILQEMQSSIEEHISSAMKSAG